MSDSVNEVLGRILADHAKARMLRMGAPSMLRLRRNEDPVMLAVAQRLRGFDFDGAGDPVLVKVTGRPGSFPGLPPEFEFGPHENAVTLRNDPNVSLVILEREDSTAAQSLSQLPTLEDQHVLSAQEESGVSVGQAAWEEATGQNTPLPAALGDAFDMILEQLQNEQGVAVRRWVEFTIGCCRESAGQARDEAETWRIVGRNLPALDLLRDEILFDAGSITARARRFRKNVFFASDFDEAGRAVDADELSLVAEKTSFTDADGTPFDDTINEEVRSRIIERLFRLPTDAPPVLDLFIWEQLFAQKERKSGLGYRVRVALGDDHPTRVDEFVELGVEEGLDARDAESARTLQNHEPEDPEARPLIELLPSRLRRTIERLAEPRSPTVGDPLRHLIHELYKIQQENGDDSSTRIVRLSLIEPGAEATRSLNLFRFLYGPTLASAFMESPTSLALDVTLDERLSASGYQLPDDDSSGDSDGDDEAADGWDPIVIVLDGEDGELHRFKWAPREQPGFIALRRLFDSAEHTTWVAPSTFEAWCLSGANGPLEGASEPQDPPIPSGPVDRWLELRRETFSTLRHGLVAETMLDYFAKWSGLLEELAEHHSPRNAPVPEVDAFLSVDTLEAESQRTLLASHPVRLRWLGTHLGRCADHLAKVCDGDLLLNSVNEGLYFDTLGRLSAHEQPAILTAGEEIYLAVREQDGHEHFSRLKDDRGRTKHDWLSELDDASVKVLADVVQRYLESHPQKSDGLSLLLVVREGGARVAARLIESALVNRGQMVPTDLHIIAPESSFPDLEEVLQQFDDPSRRGDTDTPLLHTTLHPWGPELLPDLAGVDLEVDLAVVPNLFGASTNAIERSRSRTGGHGHFDVWGGKTSYIDQHVADDRGVPNVSRVLLPEQPDPPTWDWSTVNVRQNRGAPVSSDDNGPSVDYLTLQVRFSTGAELYERLHQLAHWVVTLDAFIGRAQIEMLDSSPDVILMNPRVGKNEAYNLVVSSKSGRDFVVSRLKAKLSAEIGTVPEGVVEQLYDRGRSLFPGLVLRCLGLGWAVQELTGLVLTHELVETRRPAPDGRGFDAWISLDEQIRWFAGAQHRADVARISARMTDGRLVVDVLVVESKFRLQTSTDQADAQVRQSIELLQDALAPRLDGTSFADGRFWRSQVLDVAEQSSRRKVESGQVAALRCWDSPGVESDRIDEEVRNLFLDGDYELRRIDGLVSTMSATQESQSAAEDLLTAGGHWWYRLGRQGIVETLSALVEKREVAVLEPTIEKPPTEPTSTEAEDSSLTPPARASSDEDEVTEDRVEVAETRADRKSPAEMETLYQKVMDVFVEFGVSVSRPEAEPYAEGPGFFVFRVVPGRGVRNDSVMKYASDLKLKLGLERDFATSAYVDGGAVVFEVPKADDDRYFVSAGDMWRRWTWTSDALSTPIGEDINGDVIGIDFSSSDSPHLLIAGLTGSGKSVALETILQGLARHHPPERLRLALVDPKATELNDFEDSAHLLGPIGFDPEDAIEALQRGVDEMQHRRTLFRSAGARSLPDYNSKVADEDRLPWWLIVLDEYADIASDPQDKKAVEQLLKRLSQKARASGIHVIVATQKPSAEVISTTVRSNLPAQLALRVKTASDSRVILDEGGAEGLAGKGDALLKTARRTIRVQCALYKDPS